MRAEQHYLAPSITEGWLRQYQVLPGRTHPTMQTSGSGGYLLQTIRVYVPHFISMDACHLNYSRRHSYPVEGAVSTLASERRIQRQRQAAAKRKRKVAEAVGGPHDDSPKKKIKVVGKAEKVEGDIVPGTERAVGIEGLEPGDSPFDVDMLDSPVSTS